MSRRNLTDKKETADLPSGYQKRLEISVFFSLFLFIFLFYTFPVLNPAPADLQKVDITMEIVKIPQVERPKPPPRPKLPAIPVEAKEDDMLDEVEIDFNKLQDEWLTHEPIAPIPEDTTDTYEFVNVSEKPKLIKAVAPVYPELAVKAGITGKVVVKVLIDKKGDVEKAEILKSCDMLDEAALAAAWQLKFKPGKQRDKFVKVWMSVPFQFRNPN